MSVTCVGVVPMLVCCRVGCNLAGSGESPVREGQKHQPLTRINSHSIKCRLCSISVHTSSLQLEVLDALRHPELKGASEVHPPLSTGIITGHTGTHSHTASGGCPGSGESLHGVSLPMGVPELSGVASLGQLRRPVSLNTVTVVRTHISL